VIIYENIFVLENRNYEQNRHITRAINAKSIINFHDATRDKFRKKSDINEADKSAFSQD